ncbi:2-hydroxyacyl-CoA dehydratase [Geomonas sp. Red32]|uniref:2-hydroxyacyl-CoA dehydratase family protein n=1 Tax=Geomonas sp. Red32 TaxID=2912856 RepID=UPI00202CAFC9|nr:2-hydroxyacyl-CoA dehydratase [Geomonas sp. Red32]MCM0080309.1 2-hydroxyacyl-CoA dehydratase [Geomonas sp. Red32]
MQKIGFTSTIPLEVLIAAGARPVDLNNIFITNPESISMIDEAELAGLPRNVCAWIKGIYSAVLASGINEMIGVTEGDCSYTKALMELLSLKGIRVHPFAYPAGRDAAKLKGEIENLMAHLGVGWEEVNEAKRRLDGIRAKVHEIDRLSWEEDRVTGEENHYFQVCTSDMNGDPAAFEAEVDGFLAKARLRPARKERIRLAYLGVPPIVSGLYRFLEEHDARVVFNETQRQFSMPYGLNDMVEQYRAYTYPYDIFHRIEDIARELKLRRVDGIIHYVQSFCFRQMEDMVLRQSIQLPILTLEGDKPSEVDARTKIRVEGFLELLEDRL